MTALFLRLAGRTPDGGNEETYKTSEICPGTLQDPSSLASESQMTSQVYRVPGVFLCASTLLLIITSVSLPYLPAMDFVRAHVQSGNITVVDVQGVVVSQSIAQLKVSDLVFDASGWPLIGVVHSSGCGLGVRSGRLLKILSVPPLDTLIVLSFGTRVRVIYSPSTLVGLEVWLFTQPVRNQ